MSLARLVYYSAILAGWGAFIAWLIAESAVLGRIPFEVVITAAIVGGAIGCAVNVASGLGGGGIDAIFRRALPGLLGGAAGGAVGGLLGDAAYSFGLPRGLGWMLMGVGIGVVEGVQEKSLNKIRNGLIGGTLGGLVGGFLFDPIQAVVSSGSGMSSRATAFVVLGLAIGAGIGLAQVVLKDAWLTVLDGYRPGRQLILSRPITTLGRAEHLPLPFMGSMNTDLAPEHVRISRQQTGAFTIEDVSGGMRASLNRQPIASVMKLNDGDVIKLGSNLIRFNERSSRGNDQAPIATATATPTRTPPPAPPPPPVPGSPPRPVGQPKAPPQPPQANTPSGVRPISTPVRPPVQPRSPGAGPRTPPPPPPPPPKRG